jgi:hypothetical protein
MALTVRPLSLKQLQQVANKGLRRMSTEREHKSLARSRFFALRSNFSNFRPRRIAGNERSGS